MFKQQIQQQQAFKTTLQINNKYNQFNSNNVKEPEYCNTNKTVVCKQHFDNKAFNNSESDVEYSSDSSDNTTTEKKVRNKFEYTNSREKMIDYISKNGPFKFSDTSDTESSDEETLFDISNIRKNKTEQTTCYNNQQYNDNTTFVNQSIKQRIIKSGLDFTRMLGNKFQFIKKYL